jgi:hypothetical protein
MINIADFNEISSIQASLFVTNFSLSTSRILKMALDHFSDQFDGDPTVLPLPDDAPKEIPRIVLERKDKSMKLEIAPLRLNLFRTKTRDEDRIVPKEFLSTKTSMLGKIVEDIRADCVRMAIVLERFCPKKDPARDIATHFSKQQYLKEPFDRPSAFELHSLKKYSYLNSFEVNSWVRIKSGKVSPEKGVFRPVIIAHQDMNTLVELMDTRIYNNNDISMFFCNIFEEFNNILKLYFPQISGD